MLHGGNIHWSNMGRGFNPKLVCRTQNISEDRMWVTKLPGIIPENERLVYVLFEDAINFEPKYWVYEIEENLEEYRNIDGKWGFRLFQTGQYLDTAAYYGFTPKQPDDIVRVAGHSGKNQLPVVELEYKGERFIRFINLWMMRCS